MEKILEIKDLYVSVDGKNILNGINLDVALGEIHAVMGPNGSGKSTLANVLAGRPGYEATSGTVRFKGKDLLEMEPDERALAGVFLAFQYPIEIPGVTNLNFLKTAVNEHRKARDEPELDAFEFYSLVQEKLKIVDLVPEFLNRAVNHGFSGGEKKRNEMFQMALLEPELAIMDETDSGLDIDALRELATGAQKLHNDANAFVVITHYQRLLNFIVPDHVHILFDGRIVESGDKQLALRLEEQGYDWIREKHADTQQSVAV